MSSSMDTFMQQLLHQVESSAPLCIVRIVQDNAKGASAAEKHRKRVPTKTPDCATCRWLSIQKQDYDADVPPTTTAPRRRASPTAFKRSISEPQIKKEGRPKLPIRRSSSQTAIQNMKKTIDVPRLPKRTSSRTLSPGPAASRARSTAA